MSKEFTFRGVRFRCKKKPSLIAVIFSRAKLRKKIPNLTHCKMTRSENGYITHVTLTLPLPERYTFAVYGYARDPDPKKSLQKALACAREDLSDVVTEIRKVKRSLR